MANEIWMTADEAFTLYALIWRQTDDKVWNDTDSQWDTYTDADILKYDVPLTNQVDSDYHSANFPSVIVAGVYRVQIMLQIGGAIDADADYGFSQGEFYWDGTAEINIYTLDAGIDALIGEQGKILNIYGVGE